MLLNPAARHPLGARRQLRLEALLSRRFVVKVLAPTSAGDMARAVQREVDRCDALVLAGGDGTINAALNAADRPDLTVAILPLGTANDLARHVAIPLDVEHAAARILTGTARLVDVLDVNGYRFCTVGGLGLVADCALTVTRLRTASRLGRAVIRSLGSIAYQLSAIANILLRSNILHPVRITYRRRLEDREATIDLVSHGLFIANQPTLAATLALYASSDSSDGVFELCLLPAGSRMRLLCTLARMALGAQLPVSALQVLPATHALIHCSHPTTVFGDGEFLCCTPSHHVRITPRALRVIR